MLTFIHWSVEKFGDGEGDSGGKGNSDGEGDSDREGDSDGEGDLVKRREFKVL